MNRPVDTLARRLADVLQSIVADRDSLDARGIAIMRVSSDTRVHFEITFKGLHFTMVKLSADGVMAKMTVYNMGRELDATCVEAANEVYGCCVVLHNSIMDTVMRDIMSQLERP